VATRALPHFQIAWQRFKVCWRVFVLSTLTLFASWVGLEVTVVALQRQGVFLNVALHIAWLVLFSGLMVGIHHMSLQAVDGQHPTLNDVSSLLGRGPRMLLASTFYSLAVGIGFLLLVAPGVYVAVRHALFGHFIAAGEKSAFGALRDAGAVSRGHWRLLCRFLALAVALNLGGACLLGVGLLVSFPVSLLAFASVFRTLQHAAVEARP
jgi:hypothetical protein